MPVKAWHTLRFAALLIATTFAQPALADDWETCAKGSGDDAISACTRAIKSGTYNGRTLALAYSNRGVEWKAKGELAKAIADYDEAIKHDPQQPAVYNNRGIAYASAAEYRTAAIRVGPGRRKRVSTHRPQLRQPRLSNLSVRGHLRRWSSIWGRSRASVHLRSGLPLPMPRSVPECATGSEILSDYPPPSASASQARANAQWRSAVAREMPSSSAACSSVKPAK